MDHRDLARFRLPIDPARTVSDTRREVRDLEAGTERKVVFAAWDSVGRQLGITFWMTEQAGSHIVRGHTTRDGMTFGAMSKEQTFGTPEARDAYVAKRINAAAKRAARAKD